MQAHFGTLGEDELVDPTISPATLLFRLFHEEGVRLFKTTPVRSHCRCSREKIISVLGSFPSAERGDMLDVEGNFEVTCEYCSRVYQIEPEALDEREG